LKGYITDILVIGSGGAGLRAALAAKETDPSLKVTIMTAGNVGEDSVTATACSDRMAFHVAFDHTPPGGEDAWKEHAKDIYIGGGCVSDPNLAVLLAYKAKDAFAYLGKLGVPWVRDTDGKPEQFLTDSSTYPRACYTGPYTARDIHQALLKEVRRRNIEMWENYQLMFLSPPDIIPGFYVDAHCMAENHYSKITTHSIILATGGPGALFGSPLYSEYANAIPFFLALNYGAKLVNLEFIQYGLVSPKTKLACSGSLLRALPKVIDEEGRELLAKIEIPGEYCSYLELLLMKGASWPVSVESTVLPVDIEIWKATASGKTIFLDFRENPYGLNENIYSDIVSKRWEGGKNLPYAPTPYERLQKANPEVIKWFSERGINLKAEKVEIRHEVQHFQGGILINEKAETGVPGLFACGECAGGQHGANRPGGNSLLDGQVMGAIAGREAAIYAQRKIKTGYELLNQPTQPLLEKGDLTTYNFLWPGEPNIHIVETLQREVGVLRTTDGLKQAYYEIEGIAGNDAEQPHHKEVSYVPKHILIIAQCFILAALARDESRGSHIRFESSEDLSPLPRKDPEGIYWNFIYVDENGKLQVEKTPVPKAKKEDD
jgi:succinate dehydrogenase / fumarate reductase flavoprotein subunit